MSKKLGQMNQKIWTIWAKNSSNYQKGSSNEHKNTSNKQKKIVQMSKRKYFKMNQKDSSKEQLLFSSFELNILFIWTIFCPNAHRMLSFEPLQVIPPRTIIV